jgi:hypothetical protein
MANLPGLMNWVAKSSITPLLQADGFMLAPTMEMCIVLESEALSKHSDS